MTKLLIYTMFALGFLGITQVSYAVPAFNFACANGKCPAGPYKSSCPICNYQGPQGPSQGYLQCFCFDDNDSLANLTILHGGRCKKGYQIGNTNGSLTCVKSSAPIPTNPPATGQVDFKFNCVTDTLGYTAQPASNCPTKGNYEQYCPRCNYTSADGGYNTLECMCFDENATMHSIDYLDANGPGKCNTGVFNAQKGNLVCGK